MTKLEEYDFTRVTISEGMDAETALKALINWIKASPHRSSAFERLIAIPNCSELSAPFVATIFDEEHDLFSNATNRFVNIRLQKLKASG